MKIKFKRSERRTAKTRVYFFHDDETIMDQFMNRHDRPYRAYRAMLPQIFEQVDLLKQGTKARWSQYAGCSCPCSPGFIIDNSYGYDVFVHIDNDTNVTTVAIA